MITCAMCDDELPSAEQLRSLVMAYAKKKRVELQAETCICGGTFRRN